MGGNWDVGSDHRAIRQRRNNHRRGLGAPFRCAGSATRTSWSAPRPVGLIFPSSSGDVLRGCLSGHRRPVADLPQQGLHLV